MARQSVIRGFEGFQEFAHRLDVSGERFASGRGHAVRGFGAQANERVVAREVAILFEASQMQVQAAVRCLQTFLERGEVERAIYLQGREDTQANRAVHVRVEAVEINWRHVAFPSCGIARPGWP